MKSGLVYVGTLKKLFLDHASSYIRPNNFIKNSNLENQLIIKQTKNIEIGPNKE